MKKELKNKTGPKPVDYTGINFNKLTVLYRKNKRWYCKCDCGNLAIVRCNDIKEKKRIGCKSCTASIRSAKKNKHIDHYGYINRLYREYKKGADKRKLVFDLNILVFNEIIKNNCYYCNSEPEEKPNKKYMIKTIDPLKVNGVDRKDNNIGYTLNNCVSCCSKCNYAKHMMSIEEFFSWIKKVVYHQNL